MLLEQYNYLISSMLNQKQTLTKLRAELKGEKGRNCWSCKRFGHVAHNCRNKGEEGEGKPIP